MKLIGGAALFGAGWGMSGLCPGPGMIDFFTLSPCVIWLPALAIGIFAADFIDKTYNCQTSSNCSKS